MSKDILNIFLDNWKKVVNEEINQKYIKGDKKMKRKYYLIIGVAILFIFGLSLSIHRVPTGYVGMVYSVNGLEEKPLTQGFKLIAPWKKVTSYNISLEQAFLSADSREGSLDNDSFDIPSKDGKMVNVDFEFSYRFDEDKITDIYTMFRGKSVEIIKDTFMRAKIKAWASEISSKYTVMDIYGDKRIQLNQDVYNHLKNKFSQYGIEIESANFSRISVDPQTEKAIQENINAQQALIKIQLQVNKEKIETEIAKERSERGKVEIDLRNYQLVSQAKAEAEANNLRNKTITKEMIELEKIRKWNGQLPMYQGIPNTFIELK